MPTKIEKDALTGIELKGHEWDGIKELNTPLPRWWLYVFYATIVWAAGYMVFYPAVPWLGGHSVGVLGYTARDDLGDKLKAQQARRAGGVAKIEAAAPAAILKDQELLKIARRGGEVAFKENCAACHGVGGAGTKGSYPVLADDDWIWGGSVDAIALTIRHGIRSEDPNARASEMPAYGAGLLTPAQIDEVAEFVLSLSGKATSTAAAGKGSITYAEQCAACHGEKGQGNVELGAPKLSDQIWLYGGTKAAIVAQVSKPRQGVMPAFEGRLDETTRKMLAVYVHALGGGQ